MIATILRRELREYWRNKPFRVLFCVLLALVGVASLDGWNRAQQAAMAKKNAEVGDHDNWVEQGENNPHGAAHFARYAFRPTPPLAAFEPGVLDFAGAAVWMEAHHQNPATLRRAEDSLARAPLSALSAGWVLRVLGSLALVLLLFRAVAQERETGTMRSIAAIGVSSQDFVLGKIAAAGIAALGLALAAVFVSFIPALFVFAESVDPSRVFGLVAVSLIGLVTFGLATIAISAKSQSSGASMIASAALWLIWVVGVPTLGAQLSTAFYPDVDEHLFKSTLQEESQNKFWKGGAKEPAVAELEAKILKKHGVDSLDKLKFNRMGIMLQAHEEFANEIFDWRFGQLYSTHLAQDRVMSITSLASPLLALQRISAGLAGTDLLAQQNFTAQAEAHRRKIVVQLNTDLMENGGDKGMKYMAGRDLWEQIEDFKGEDPSLGQVLQRYLVELVSLLAWLFIALVTAFRFTHRAMRSEVSS